MKRIKIFSMILLGGCLIAATSCKKYLDVNNNPNAPTDVTPDLILPAALAQTAANNVTFNSYGAWAGGYQANAGGYGGFGSVLTYNYATSDNTGLWSSSFNNLNDYQTIINKSDATGPYKNYYAIAKIMKAFCYLRLIDVYNDVPYTEALKGISNLSPKYDKAEDVYKGLFAELDEAIAALALPNDPKSTISTTTSANSQRIDVVTTGTGLTGGSSFSEGNFPTSKWTEFANTLKLKMLVRTRLVSTFSTTFAAEKAKLASSTFISYDVQVQPGYAAQDGKQNPSWNAYAYNATGGNSQLTVIPTWYAIGFYNGIKLSDYTRGVGYYTPTITYKNYTTANQLGITDQFVPTSPNGGPWYTGSASGTSGDGLGVLKGPTMSQPLMLASESYFLQAEASLFGIISGGNAAAITAFNNGIKASQTYLNTKQNGTLQAGDVTDDPATTNPYNANDVFEFYTQEENPTSYLVDLTRATTPAQELEAIITQKWISENYIHSNEGWSDYRRTSYPVQQAGGDKYHNFASTQSTSTNTDKLPVRVLYPASEYALNSANVPTGINPFTSRVFYDLN